MIELFSSELAESPTLTMAAEIIENKYTLAGKEFSCTGELGYPTGHMEIQSDFNGEFDTFLTLQDNDNGIAFINDHSNDTTDGTCRFVQTIKYAFDTAKVEYHLKRFRCALYPSEDADDQSVLYSEEKPVIVVRGKYTQFFPRKR